MVATVIDTDEECLRRACDAAPLDAAPRGIYADWLRERGREADADRWCASAHALTTKALEPWRRSWREGYAPGLPLAGLDALRTALVKDDPRLVQGSTTTPPPLLCVQDWPCEAADAIGFCGWQDAGLKITTVGEVEEFFARHCFDADQRLGEAAACRWFLNWFDDTPRDEMRRELLGEVELAIATRTGAESWW